MPNLASVTAYLARQSMTALLCVVAVVLASASTATPTLLGPTGGIEAISGDVRHPGLGFGAVRSEPAEGVPGVPVTTGTLRIGLGGIEVGAAADAVDDADLDTDQARLFAKIQIPIKLGPIRLAAGGVVHPGADGVGSGDVQTVVAGTFRLGTFLRVNYSRTSAPGPGWSFDLGSDSDTTAYGAQLEPFDNFVVGMENVRDPGATDDRTNAYAYFGPLRVFAQGVGEDADRYGAGLWLTF